MPNSRRLQVAASQLRTAQNLFEKAVHECRAAGFEVSEIATIARITPDQVAEILDSPRTI